MYAPSQEQVTQSPRGLLSLKQVGGVGDVRPLPGLGRPRFMSRPRETLFPSFPRHCSPRLTEVTETGRQQALCRGLSLWVTWAWRLPSGSFSFAFLPDSLS